MVKSNDEHLLVIRLSAMGDVAMTVPVLLALIRTHPKLQITVLTRPFFAPIFKNIPNLNVYTIDVKDKNKGILGLYRLSKELRKIPFTGVADLHNVLRTKILKVFLYGKGLPFVQIDKGRKEKKHLTTWKNKTIKPLKTTHERYADVFRQLGYSIELSPEDVLQSIQPSVSVKKYLGDQTLKTIGIAPFAAFSGKMYPSDLMEGVLKNLDNTKRYKIILFGGGAKEKEVLSQLETKYTHCDNMTAVLSFEDELCLISNLALMVSMDSGNGHLAAMFGVPTLTLWGITHPYAGFAPYGQESDHSILSDREQYPMIPTSVYGNKYPKGYKNVMYTIDPEDVVRKIETLLN
ncbi:glycosyltransferase family 9 protein [uncultured Muriicola sp.]|uniref:glycosyltransferase family 9 protein n=1 Tax=uncultured Muriicola sp. TaxID=1583102 RepID=UPI00262BD04F|nr:glycosyltransferase family 9 protein [uncultured Muriicola sp.]